MRFNFYYRLRILKLLRGTPHHDRAVAYPVVGDGGGRTEGVSALLLPFTVSRYKSYMVKGKVQPILFLKTVSKKHLRIGIINYICKGYYGYGI